MASENRTTPSVPQIVHPPIRFKPIHFSAHDVALMAYWANELSDSFVRAIHSYWTPAFLGYHLDRLVTAEEPSISPSIQRALNVNLKCWGDVFNIAHSATWKTKTPLPDGFYDALESLYIRYVDLKRPVGHDGLWHLQTFKLYRDWTRSICTFVQQVWPDVNFQRLIEKA
jgi:hypothetical protein